MSSFDWLTFATLFPDRRTNEYYGTWVKSTENNIVSLAFQKLGVLFTL